MAWFLRMLQESKGADETDGIGEVGELPNGSEVVIDESQVLPNGDVPVLPADEADGSLFGYGYGYGVEYGEASGNGTFLWNTILFVFFLTACCVCGRLLNARRAELGAAGRGSGTVLAHAVQPVSRDSTVVIGEVIPGSLVRGDVI